MDIDSEKKLYVLARIQTRNFKQNRRKGIVPALSYLGVVKGSPI
jgi:hypothetical protein